jgi:hypothetical protein
VAVVALVCSWRRWVVKSPLYVSVHHGSDFATIGPLNLRADMDAQHMVELVRSLVAL